jgi:shikimate dehydrogenase
VLPPIVDGTTRLLGIIGDPVAQVRSPALWTALFRHNEINAICVPFHVHPADFSGFVRGLRAAKNLLGLYVTIPHKLAAAQFADVLLPRADKSGTANVLRPLPDGGWEGDMLDGLGFVLALRADGQSVEGRRALVVGSGGVGSAIGFALADAGAAIVAVSDIDPERADRLARRIISRTGTKSYVSQAQAAGFDLIVNASPLGMLPDDPLPLDLAGLTADAIVGDVVVSAGLTPILRAARERGCHVQAGSAMTDHQAPAMAEFLGLPVGDWNPAAIRAATASDSGAGVSPI